jgi:hypothetical protein
MNYTTKKAIFATQTYTEIANIIFKIGARTLIGKQTSLGI